MTASPLLKGMVTLKGGMQVWTVPATQTYRITAAGAGTPKSLQGSHGIPTSGATVSGNVQLRQGDVLLTLFAEVGGSEGPSGTRRVIDQSAVDAACARILEAYGFSKGAADAHKPSQLIRCFIDRDGSVKRL